MDPTLVSLYILALLLLLFTLVIASIFAPSSLTPAFSRTSVWMGYTGMPAYRRIVPVEFGVDALAQNQSSR